MASRVAFSALQLGLRRNVPKLPLRTSTVLTPARAAVCTETGAMLPRPEINRFGVIKVLAVVVPFVLTGAKISMEVAALLEEHDLFIPDDDDDD